MPQFPAKHTSELTFKEKLSAISSSPLLQELPSSGYNDKQDYSYDKAADIFPIFNSLLQQYRITPPNRIREIDYDTGKEIGIEQIDRGGWLGYKVSCKYVIEDVDSDNKEFIYGSGEGFGQWALEIAFTWAMKRALKDRFLASRPIPESDKKKTVEDTFNLPMPLIAHQQQAAAVKQEMEDFFGGANKDEAEQEEKDLQEQPDGKTPKLEEHEKEETKPLEGMSRPGKKQQERIAPIREKIQGVYEAMKKPELYNEQILLNAIWSFKNRNRWPKDEEEMIDIRDTLVV